MIKPEDINILIACEESGVLTAAFRELGFNAWSCDILPTRGKYPHFQCDIMELLSVETPVLEWDIIIAHPDCTKLSLSGNRWYGKGTKGYPARVDAIRWTIELWKLMKAKSKIGCALENPTSVIWRHIGKPQYIQPHDFGHGETKKTGILTHNLPLLRATNKVAGREQRIWKMPPGKNRKRDRSVTYSGVAQAIAEQYGNFLITNPLKA